MRYWILRNEIVELYKSMSVHKIEERLGVPHDAVRKILIAAGVKLRPMNGVGNGRCLDCGQSSGLARRCELHRRIRLEARKLAWYYRRKSK